MFDWLRRRREEAQQRQIERLLVEVKAYRALWRHEHGDEPFPLTPEQRQELQRMRDQLSPEARRRIDTDNFFSLDDDPSAGIA